MTLRLPTSSDLKRLAENHYFTLTPEETEAYQALILEIAPLFAELDAMPDPAPVGKYAQRDPGRRPERGSDPHNAIVRRCSVKGASAGLLAGKRVGLKDNVCVAGIPMTYGSPVLQDFIPDRDATVVTRLLDAGAEIVAMLNMDNFAFSGRGDTSGYGATLNPHNPMHLAGGSSGGSAAALHYDDIDITLGADRGGSIRIPAAWCGVVGLKPTHGLVPYSGIGGIDHTVDHVGPMARSVREVALAMEAIAGKDPADPRQGVIPVQPYVKALERDLRGMRIGVLTEGFGLEGAEPDVEAAVRGAIETLGKSGADVIEVSVPAHRSAGAICWGLLAEGMAATLGGNGMGYHWRGTYDPGLAEAMGRSLQARSQQLPPQVKLVSMLGTHLRQQHHGRYYAKAQNLRPQLRADYDAVLQMVDLLVMPTTPMKAHLHQPGLGIRELVKDGWNMLGNAAPFNVTGHPSITVPCAMSNGLPIGLMFTGRQFDDATVLAAANAFERSGDWTKR